MTAISFATCTCNNNIDIRGVRRGACSLCTCSGFFSPSGTVLCERCNHPPANHENLTALKTIGRVNHNTTDHQNAHTHLSTHSTENPTLAQMGQIKTTKQQTVVNNDHTNGRAPIHVCNDDSSPNTTIERTQKGPVNTVNKQTVLKNEPLVTADNKTVLQSGHVTTAEKGTVIQSRPFIVADTPTVVQSEKAKVLQQVTADRDNQTLDQNGLVSATCNNQTVVQNGLITADNQTVDQNGMATANNHTVIHTAKIF